MFSSKIPNRRIIGLKFKFLSNANTWCFWLNTCLALNFGLDVQKQGPASNENFMRHSYIVVLTTFNKKAIKENPSLM